VFLVSLCSADIETCRLVTTCLALLCEESGLTNISEASKKSSTLVRNMDAYLELSSRDFRFTGLVAFQKRVRTILKRLIYPTPGILAAWETVFVRWYDLSTQITSHQGPDSLSERSLVEWRNYSGFLASLGGSCVSDQAVTVDESGLVGLKWIDRPSQDIYDDTILDRYLTQSVHLLACSNVRVREATREVLSAEISPSLYLPLFRILESELERLFDVSDEGQLSVQDDRLIFAEQAASLLKTIVERLSTPEEIDAALSIDIGALTLSFARFLDVAPDGLNTLRIKIKVCQLCEVITRKKELLNLRHDVRIRNQLLEVIFGWIARPGSPTDAIFSSASRADEPLRLQKDLDRASLKALADLTYRLPLQPAEGQSDADTSDAKASMFRTYFNRFLSLLSFESPDSSRLEINSTREDPVPISEMAISALSNLLSANIDVGLKHSLSIGYHEDLRIRTAFVRVLCNILAQGTTDFNNFSDAAVSEKYEHLLGVGHIPSFQLIVLTNLKLLLGDMTLTIALCDACPSTEVDELTISLLNIFDSRGLGFVLLQALIEHEVDQTGAFIN
jgi:neurofibromin 1